MPWGAMLFGSFLLTQPRTTCLENGIANRGLGLSVSSGNQDSPSPTYSTNQSHVGCPSFETVILGNTRLYQVDDS